MVCNAHFGELSSKAWVRIEGITERSTEACMKEEDGYGRGEREEAWERKACDILCDGLPVGLDSNQKELQVPKRVGGMENSLKESKLRKGVLELN